MIVKCNEQSCYNISCCNKIRCCNDIRSINNKTKAVVVSRSRRDNPSDGGLVLSDVLTDTG